MNFKKPKNELIGFIFSIIFSLDKLILPSYAIAVELYNKNEIQLGSQSENQNTNIILNDNFKESTKDLDFFTDKNTKSNKYSNLGGSKTRRGGALPGPSTKPSTRLIPPQAQKPIGVTPIPPQTVPENPSSTLKISKDLKCGGFKMSTNNTDILIGLTEEGGITTYVDPLGKLWDRSPTNRDEFSDETKAQALARDLKINEEIRRMDWTTLFREHQYTRDMENFFREKRKIIEQWIKDHPESNLDLKFVEWRRLWGAQWEKDINLPRQAMYCMFLIYARKNMRNLEDPNCEKELHHIRPAYLGGAFQLENSIYLCIDYHVLAHLFCYVSSSFLKEREILRYANLQDNLADYLYNEKRLNAFLREPITSKQNEKIVSEFVTQATVIGLKGFNEATIEKLRIFLTENEDSFRENIYVLDQFWIQQNMDYLSYQRRIKRSNKRKDYWKLSAVLNGQEPVSGKKPESKKEAAKRLKKEQENEIVIKKLEEKLKLDRKELVGKQLVGKELLAYRAAMFEFIPARNTIAPIATDGDLVFFKGKKNQIGKDRSYDGPTYSQFLENYYNIENKPRRDGVNISEDEQGVCVKGVYYSSIRAAVEGTKLKRSKISKAVKEFEIRKKQIAEGLFGYGEFPAPEIFSAPKNGRCDIIEPTILPPIVDPNLGSSLGINVRVQTDPT